MGRTLVVFLFALLHVDIFLTTPVPTEPQHAAWRISRLRHSRHLGGRSGNHLSDDFLPHVVPLPARQAAAGNRKPVFSNCSRYQATVREEQNPGTEVIRVTAVDRDPPETGGTVTYTFVSAPGERLKFDIDPDTGRIVTRNVFDRDEPSREKEMYLTVRATDNGRPQLDDVCTIKVTIEDVNDNKPVFDKVVLRGYIWKNYVESVPQDLRAGREVMRISATDIDDGNNSVVTYELRPRNPELDQGYFRVDPATGVIYLNRTLDREPGYKFRMNATATDQGDPPRSSHIELEILVVESHKKAPTFTQVPERAIVLSENYNEYQRPVATLVAESNIAESELVFMILPGRTEQTNSRNTFVLESEGSTARVKLGRQLDYEAASEYTITVRVQNKYNLAAETVLNIQVLDVNDNIPVFTEVASGTVLEHEPEGAPVMQVRAIDADGTAQHSQVTYELGDHQDLFSIDPYTGNITTRVMFDREDKDFYIVKVVASDNSPSALLTTGESNKGQQVFHIEIGDINDNRPKFTKRVYFAEVTEDENIHSLVTEVRALDNDTASEVTYSLENGNVGEAFLVEKNTGKIRVANALDYENTTSYTLLVRAFDGIYDDYATVEVRVDNVNDNRPVFLPSNRNITIMEEHLVSGCITRLEAYDPDVPRREDSQRIRFFLVKEEQKRYLTLERDGCLSLVKPLDRDSPRGFPQWQVLVLARDEDGGPSSLSESTEVVINLVDINDNAPFLSQQQSVVWPENRTPGVITTLHADDLDGEGHAAPFQFSLALTAEDEIRTSFRVSVGGDGVARLEALRTFDREYRREYGVPIAISDSGSPSMTGTSTLTVVIGDENDNSMRPGASDIFVYNFKGLEDTVIGRVYVEDPDDWDLADKRFAWLGGVPHPNFQLDLRTGELSVLGDPESGSYLLEFLVVEESRLVARHAVGASVTVTVRRIPEEAVIKSGSMRLANISAENFVEPPPGKLQSRRDVLRDQLATLLNVSADNVDVFTVLPTDSGEFLDVRYSVHGSPYYAPEKLDGAVAQRLRDMELMLGVRVWTTPVDACLEENVCGAGSCVSRLVVASRPYVVTTNTSSFVGVHAAVQHECGCERVLKYQASCLNGGTPADYGCNCPPGHEGPNCEVIDVGFSGDGWAWYPPPAACETASLSLELQTDREDGLVFYLGPLSTAAGLRLSDFMSLELTEGHARLLADYGSGTTKLEQPQLKLSDGRKHRIEIHWSAASIELKVDSCATCLALTAPEGPSQLLNVNGPLQLGGTSLNLDQLAHDLGWKYTPTDQGLSGCVRNLTFSGNVYELGAPSVSHRAVAGCARAVAKAVTLGVDTNFLLVVLACTALLFALVAAAAALRGRGEAAAWRERGDEDVRENIVCYEDEGGGEGDMTGYDLSVLRLLYEETAGITKTKQAPRAAPEGMAETGSDLVESARQAEMSTDDLRHYAYEGDGDSVGSLSSLASGTDEGDLSFVQLHDFGPRFRKLADMYGGQSSDEEEV